MKVLTKSSSSEEIKMYFNTVLMLAKASEKYPVNLDEVWMLVYERKDNATKALTRDFIEGEDFITVRQKAEGGKFASIDYFLSVPCLEYFIARKVRPVFEVYRQVFHKVTNTSVYLIPQTYSEALLLAANQAREIEQLNLEKQQLASENERNRPKVQFADCIMQASTCISVAEMANILKQNGLFYKGQNALYGYLRYNGYLLQRGIRRNLPSQKAIDKGVMRIAERPYITNGQVGFHRIAVITPYGQKFFLQLFRSMKENNENIMTLF
ncbi:phage antirepressor KilAC domain-containing protein [Bacteroides thetaiotaomicron]|uniref:phage antirepressor KilAC domain-containing protein n=1 Tax=Bacteroides thetaiotaomicron TaxID=818 RepID=UPI0034A469A0